CIDVIQALNHIKEKVSQSCKRPSQIIQDIAIEISEDSFYYMPNNKALRRQISYIQLRNTLSQPQLLQEIDVSVQLQTTMRKECFLAREIDLNMKKL
ncbi:3662_t:CDS:1, partial [Racocetra persica]